MPQYNNGPCICNRVEYGDEWSSAGNNHQSGYKRSSCAWSLEDNKVPSFIQVQRAEDQLEDTVEDNIHRAAISNTDGCYIVLKCICPIIHQPIRSRCNGWLDSLQQSRSGSIPSYAVHGTSGNDFRRPKLRSRKHKKSKKGCRHLTAICTYYHSYSYSSC